MSNLTFTSQRQKRGKDQVLKLLRAGKWPPAGYQWEALAALPQATLEDFFRGPVWAALLAGLSQIADNEMDNLMNAKDIGDMRESKGIAWLANDMIKLPNEIGVIKDAEKEFAHVAK